MPEAPEGGEGTTGEEGVPSWTSSLHGNLGPRAQLTGFPRVQVRLEACDQRGRADRPAQGTLQTGEQGA